MTLKSNKTTRLQTHDFPVQLLSTLKAEATLRGITLREMVIEILSTWAARQK